MSIRIETTPNAEALKFVPGRTVLDQGTMEITSSKNLKFSPLAQALFEHPGVDRVFLGRDFVTVTKIGAASWDTLALFAQHIISSHVGAGKPIVTEAGKAVLRAEASVQKPETPAVKEIRKVLDKINPAIAEDGGKVVFVEFKEAQGVLLLRLEGACAGCASSQATLKQGIETIMKQQVPQVREVQQVRPEGVANGPQYAKWTNG